MSNIVDLLFAASDAEEDPEFKELLREAATKIGAQAMRLDACDAQIKRLVSLVEGLTASLKKLDAVIDFSAPAEAEDELMGIRDPSAFNEAIECARAALSSTVGEGK